MSMGDQRWLNIHTTSHCSPASRSRQQHPECFTSLDFQPRPGEDDVPFDAFDRELLAQLAGEQHKGPECWSSHPSPLLTPDPKPHPRIFHNCRRISLYSLSLDILLCNTISDALLTHRTANDATATPLHRSLPNSSGLGLEPPSSPSIYITNQGRHGSFSGKKFDNNNGLQWSPPFFPADISFSSKHQIAPTSGAESCKLQLSHAPPMVQGIRLVSAHELPDRFRSLFSFPVFNAIQSKCFHPIYHGDGNFVLSAPTGSGKTVIMELAVCRLVTQFKDRHFKVVYQAPTKSLCSERFRDWQTKFSSLDLQCAELTGDTDHSHLRNVQSAAIIITTPEKWDSMTRKWRDHVKLMQLVRLFLIDEVHILKETRGAALEAVVSRMKSVGSDVRFVALSATVPNSGDIAEWLGKDTMNQHLPAHREIFGEEFRPVKLQKYVYGYSSNGNHFAFDKLCEAKLSEVIAKHSHKKPIMIFCCTRNSAIATSKNLAKLWVSTDPTSRLWDGPTKCIKIQNPDLRATVSSGVAFHHAGLDIGDRHAVETGFSDGQIGVLCCTSTLAVGVNLPCHLVIIKNTVTWQDNSCKEYADLEMMQMLGRAGRPQFDDSAAAVILTRKERVEHYERLVSGSEPLESCLHLNLIDHLNAEVGLGTVTDVESATRWLAGTFFFIRLRKNPRHYQLRERSDKTNEDELLKQMCEKGLKLLQECSLVTSQGMLKPTEFGDAMARYYVKFETMKLFLSLPPKAKMSEILAAITQADEFREIRLKPGEKSLYKELNKGNGIKFPIKVDIGLAAHKISLLIQSELGAVDLPANEQYQKHRLAFQQDKGLVFSHVNRLIRCIIDCQIALADSVATRHALELARSFGARAWDNSPLQMKQIEQIGIMAVRKLANAGINSMEALETIEAHRIEMILSKNPPFGMRLLDKLANFPKPRVTVKVIGKETKPGKPVQVTFKADIGFVNENVPNYFRRRPVYVCFLAETSDGRMIDFRRLSATKLQNNYEILLKTELTHAYQYISCYVMCDEIAGTLRQVQLRQGLSASLFPAHPAAISGPRSATKQVMNTSRRRSSEPSKSSISSCGEVDEFADSSLEDGDLIAAAGDLDYIPFDEFSQDDCQRMRDYFPNINSEGHFAGDYAAVNRSEESIQQLDNGKWACNHRCKDKTSCKHLCCREGKERLPKVRKKLRAGASAQTRTVKAHIKGSGSSTVKGMRKTTHKKRIYRQDSEMREIDVIDLSGGPSKSKPCHTDKKIQNQILHEKTPPKSRSLRGPTHTAPTSSYSTRSPLHLSFLDDLSKKGQDSKKAASSYPEAIWMDDLPSPAALLQNTLMNPKYNETQGFDASRVRYPFSLKEASTGPKDPILSPEVGSDMQHAKCSEDLPSSVAKNKETCISLFPPFRRGVETCSWPIRQIYSTFSSPRNRGSALNMSSDQSLYPNWGVSSGSSPKRGLSDVGNETAVSQKRLKKGFEPPVTPPKLNLGANPNANMLGKVCEGVEREDVDPSLLGDFKDIVNFS